MSSVASWSESQSNPQGLNFDDLFSSPGFSAGKLLSISSIVEECRKQNDKITDLLIRNSSVLQDLMNVCVRPLEFKSETLGPLTRDHTYRAIEILNNLNCQQFSDYMLGVVRTKPSAEDDEVITQQNIGPKQGSACEAPLVRILFSILRQPEPLQQTPLWYMYKIGTLTCYQRPKKLLALLRDNRDICELLFHHFYSNSIFQWVVKILELQDSNSFFEADKVVIFQYLVELLGKQVQQTQQSTPVQQQLTRLRLQNYVAVMRTLLEKMEDRFDKSKYLSLAKLIFSKKQPIEPFVNVLVAMAKQNMVQSQQKMISPLTVIQKYEHFSSNYKPSVISKINNSMSRSHSLNKSNHNIERDSGDKFVNAMGPALDKSTINDIVLNSDVAANIRYVVLFLADEIVKEQMKLKLNFILEYLKLLFAVLLVCEESEQPFVSQIVTAKLSSCLFGIMRSYPTCTPLHNIIKDIYIECMFKQYDHTMKILFNHGDDCKFIEILTQMKSKGNCSIEYQNQIYYIFLVAARKSDDSLSNSRSFEEARKAVKNYEDILSKIKEKQKLYTALIGGNPRKESSCWGDSSQGEKLLPFNFSQPLNNEKKANEENIECSTNTNDIIEGNIEHWFDCGGLPLDSDESKDDLQVSLKQENAEVEKREERNNSLENDLAKRFKHIGIVECEEQQIRIPKRKQKILNQIQKNPREQAGIKQDTKEEAAKQVRDQGQIELERQIEILKNQRLHLDMGKHEEPSQIISRAIKKVDSLDGQDISPIDTQILQAYIKKPIQKEGMIEGTKIDDKSHGQQNSQPSGQNEVLILDGKTMETSLQKQVTTYIQNRLITCLSFQIEHILSELD